MALFGALLQQRAWAFWIGGMAVVQLSLAWLGNSGIGCPIRTLTGFRCPGCGLTGATVHLLRGEWQAGVTEHPFAPVFLAGLFALGSINLLPAKPRQRATQAIVRWEERTGFTLILVLLLLSYWGFHFS